MTCQSGIPEKNIHGHHPNFQSFQKGKNFLPRFKPTLHTASMFHLTFQTRKPIMTYGVVLNLVLPGSDLPPVELHRRAPLHPQVLHYRNHPSHQRLLLAVRPKKLEQALPLPTQAGVVHSRHLPAQLALPKVCPQRGQGNLPAPPRPPDNPQDRQDKVWEPGPTNRLHRILMKDFLRTSPLPSLQTNKRR